MKSKKEAEFEVYIDGVPICDYVCTDDDWDTNGETFTIGGIELTDANELSIKETAIMHLSQYADQITDMNRAFYINGYLQAYKDVLIITNTKNE